MERNKQPQYLLVGIAHVWDLPVVGTTYFIGEDVAPFLLKCERATIGRGIAGTCSSRGTL
mgnify:CR=1 FL=1